MSNVVFKTPRRPPKNMAIDMRRVSGSVPVALKKALNKQMSYDRDSEEYAYWGKVISEIRSLPAVDIFLASPLPGDEPRDDVFLTVFLPDPASLAAFWERPVFVHQNLTGMHLAVRLWLDVNDPSVEMGQGTDIVKYFEPHGYEVFPPENRAMINEDLITLEVMGTYRDGHWENPRISTIFLGPPENQRKLNRALRIKARFIAEQPETIVTAYVPNGQYLPRTEDEGADAPTAADIDCAQCGSQLTTGSCICGKVRYCDQKCMDTHWKEHSATCAGEK